MTKSNWRPVALSLTLAGAVARLVPHPPNFAPVGAISVFSGARLPGWQAFAVPLSLMIVTDPILNWMHGLPAFTRGQIFTYLAFTISVLIGRALARTESSWKIGGAVFLSSLQFFLISNLPSWYRMYPHSVDGLAACYVAALPFFERTLLSDFFFTAVLFGLHGVLSRTVASGERVAVAA